MPQEDASTAFLVWVRERVATAARLAEGECGGSYGDAMLILSAVLSGQAADLWPGKGKDRRRFTEIWSTRSSLELNPNLISVPFLLEALEKDGDSDLVEKVRATSPEAFSPDKRDSLVVTGNLVDRTEDVLLALDPRLTARKIRPFSYGNVFYEHVRSGYTHEYHTTSSASSFPQSDEHVPVSYVNMLMSHDGRTYRRIHFDVTWVADIVRSVSTSFAASGLKRPLPEPSAWWIDG